MILVYVLNLLTKILLGCIFSQKGYCPGTMYEFLPLLIFLDILCKTACKKLSVPQLSFSCLLVQVKLRHADQEIRLAQDPFPLYPGEILKQVVTQLKVVPANTAMRLRAVLDFQEDDGTRRLAGDEWLFEGPG